MNPLPPGDIERVAKRAEIQARVNAARQQLQRDKEDARLKDVERHGRIPIELTSTMTDEHGRKLSKYGWIQNAIEVDGKVGVVLPLVSKDRFLAKISSSKIHHIPSSSIVWHIWYRQVVQEEEMFTATMVDFSNKGIATLDGVELLSNLEILHLAENKIVSSSLQKVEFPNGLQTLNLGGNQIDSLQGVQFPDKLRVLDLRDNQIVSSSLQGLQFPDGLEILDLDQNQLVSLKGLQFPDGLRKLYLRGNQIVSLQEVQFPHGLQELDLSDNSITELKSKRIFFPNALEFLDLRGNSITRLERVMFPSSLKTLMLDAESIGILKNSGFPELLLRSLNFNPGVLKMYTAVRWLSDTGVWMITFKDFDYQGEGDNDKRGNTIKDGPGTFTWPDGSSYQGGVVNNAITGRGIFKYSNGDVYDGEMVNGKRHGQGKLTLVDNTVYEGVFAHDNGQGKITHPDGRVEHDVQQFFVLDVDGGGTRSKTRRKQKRKSKRYNIKIKHKSKYSRRRRRRTNRK